MPRPIYGGNYSGKASSNASSNAKHGVLLADAERKQEGGVVCPPAAWSVKLGWAAGFTRLRSQADCNLPLFLFPDQCHAGGSCQGRCPQDCSFQQLCVLGQGELSSWSKCALPVPPECRQPLGSVPSPRKLLCWLNAQLSWNQTKTKQTSPNQQDLLTQFGHGVQKLKLFICSDPVSHI